MGKYNEGKQPAALVTPHCQPVGTFHKDAVTTEDNSLRRSEANDTPQKVKLASDYKMFLNRSLPFCFNYSNLEYSVSATYGS